MGGAEAGCGQGPVGGAAVPITRSAVPKPLLFAVSGF